MNIDKYRDEDGYTNPTDDCFWDSAESYLQGAIMGFCCCGCAEKNLRYVAGILRHLDKDKRWEPHYNAWHKRAIEIAGSEDALNLAYYLLDLLQLTEHGGSIPGWPTQKGKDFLADIEELYGITPCDKENE